MWWLRLLHTFARGMKEDGAVKSEVWTCCALANEVDEFLDRAIASTLLLLPLLAPSFECVCSTSKKCILALAIVCFQRSLVCNATPALSLG